MHRAWNELHEYFDTDDGSLPEIRITKFSAHGVSPIYGLIRTVAAEISIESAWWDKRRNQPIFLYDVPNAVQMVVEEIAEPFHFIAQGIGYRIDPELSSVRSIGKSESRRTLRGADRADLRSFSMFSARWGVVSCSLRSVRSRPASEFRVRRLVQVETGE